MNRHVWRGRAAQGRVPGCAGAVGANGPAGDGRSFPGRARNRSESIGKVAEISAAGHRITLVKLVVFVEEVSDARLHSQSLGNFVHDLGVYEGETLRDPNAIGRTPSLRIVFDICEDT